MLLETSDEEISSVDVISNTHLGLALIASKIGPSFATQQQMCNGQASHALKDGVPTPSARAKRDE